MQENNRISALVLGVFIFLGLTCLGYLLGKSAIKFKEYERSITVKGLSEREYDADIVIWPIQFTQADNDLADLYSAIEANTLKIRNFLEKNGIEQSGQDVDLRGPFFQILFCHQGLLHFRLPPSIDMFFGCYELLTWRGHSIDAYPVFSCFFR